jgi:hypothetical protein
MDAGLCPSLEMVDTSDKLLMEQEGVLSYKRQLAGLYLARITALSGA